MFHHPYDFLTCGAFFFSQLSVVLYDRVRRSEENSQKGADRGQLIMHKVRILTGSDSPNNQQVYDCTKQQQLMSCTEDLDQHKP